MSDKNVIHHLLDNVMRLGHKPFDMATRSAFQEHFGWDEDYPETYNLVDFLIPNRDDVSQLTYKVKGVNKRLPSTSYTRLIMWTRFIARIILQCDNSPSDGDWFSLTHEEWKNFMAK